MRTTTLTRPAGMRTLPRFGHLVCAWSPAAGVLLIGVLAQALGRSPRLCLGVSCSPNAVLDLGAHHPLTTSLLVSPALVAFGLVLTALWKAKRS